MIRTEAGIDFDSDEERALFARLVATVVRRMALHLSRHGVSVEAVRRSSERAVLDVFGADAKIVFLEDRPEFWRRQDGERAEPLPPAVPAPEPGVEPGPGVVPEARDQDVDRGPGEVSLQ